MTDLLTIAEAQIAEKQVKEIQAIKERLEVDREVLKQAIELVNSHTLYKIVSDGFNRTRYQLATEEMLKEDYLKDGKSSYYGRGIQFLDNDSRRHYNTGVLRVNGETYFDIRYALNNYENRLSDKKNDFLSLNRQISDIEDDIKRLNEEFPSLKEAITEWQEYQKKMREKE
jgi:predicted  nucleic acid-binding Zn-ribbon protein